MNDKLLNEELEIAETEESEDSEVDSLPYRISYYPADYTLQGYVDKEDAGQLVIPPYQRSYVWDQVRASKLIESFLLGLPVPGVFLYKDKSTNKLEVIDGQQRILTAIRFFRGEFDGRPFGLKNVQARWRGKMFAELEEADRFQLQDAILRATVIQQLDPDDHSSVFHIFERLNTGGVKLSPMEIRKCVYHGDAIELLEKLNVTTEWRGILGMVKLDKRLKDVELVLRVLALADCWQEYEKPMKGFLNEFLVSVQDLPAAARREKLAAIEARFEAACKVVFAELGERPFHLKGRLNLAALDSVMVACMGMDHAADDGLKARYEALRENPSFVQSVSISTSDKSVVLRRIELAIATLRPPQSA